MIIFMLFNNKLIKNSNFQNKNDNSATFADIQVFLLERRFTK